jgi:N-acetylmuramoyl-L-alanine amidase
VLATGDHKDYDRPSARRILITAGVGVGVIAVVIVALALLVGRMALPKVPSPVTSPVVRQATHPTTSTPATLPAAVATKPPEPVAEPIASSVATGLGTVVIDAGHQAVQDSRLESIGPGSSQMRPRVESGTRGVVTGVPESKVNLDVALRLSKELKSRGVTVKMVRTTQNVDIPNSARAEIANKNHAALFIRLHCDAVSDATSNGVLVLRPGASQWTGPVLVDQGRVAAELVHAGVLLATGATDRGIVERTDLSGFNWSRVPTILVEMGVMTNPQEDRRLNDPAYQQKLATGMADGIVEYLRQRPH